MFYTGLDPYTLKPVYVAKTYEEKQMQRALLQYFKPENRKTIEKALKITGKTYLMGRGADCLIPAPAGYNSNTTKKPVRKGKTHKWQPRKRK